MRQDGFYNGMNMTILICAKERQVAETNCPTTTHTTLTADKEDKQETLLTNPKVNTKN